MPAEYGRFGAVLSFLSPERKDLADVSASQGIDR